jgi:hypothetical protein
VLSTSPAAHVLSPDAKACRIASSISPCCWHLVQPFDVARTFRPRLATGHGEIAEQDGSGTSGARRPGGSRTDCALEGPSMSWPSEFR